MIKVEVVTKEEKKDYPKRSIKGVALKIVFPTWFKIKSKSFHGHDKKQNSKIKKTKGINPRTGKKKTVLSNNSNRGNDTKKKTSPGESLAEDFLLSQGIQIYDS
jgi:hypothetical protein